MILEISEKFITLSGEAPIPGTPIYLIRFWGCNIKCSYCDTPRDRRTASTLTEKELYEDIIEKTHTYPYLKILFTGGEPLLGERQNILYNIIVRCKGITDFYIETNGSIPIHHFPGHTHFVCDWKAPSSGQEKNFAMENLKRLRPGVDCLKLVLTKEDFPWARDTLNIIHKVNPRLQIYFSPQWETLHYKDLAEFILVNRLPVTMSFQLHKIIWDNEKEGLPDDTIIQ